MILPIVLAGTAGPGRDLNPGDIGRRVGIWGWTAVAESWTVYLDADHHGITGTGALQAKVNQIIIVTQRLHEGRPE